ncbi:MAG: hypothetical protein LBQ57_02575 [Spirochaetales bacterium]|jgi:hypothetical protein|nr:hypothetical protein [Spirochaetales bacterium]
MKKMFRLLCAALAAVCVFAACSDGGDDDGLPAPKIYSGVDGSGQMIVLTITGGGYTLEIDGTIRSEGTVSTADGTITFTSDAGKTFAASATGGAPPVFSDPIPLDDNTTIAAPVFSGSDSDTAAILIVGVQVYNPDFSEFTGNADIYGWIIDDSEDGTGGANTLGKIGSIKAGKFNLNLQAVTDDKLFSDSHTGGKSGTLSFTDNTSTLRIDISLLKEDDANGFAINYFSDNYNNDGLVLNKGWNANLNTQKGIQSSRPVEWYYNNGYKWVYNPAPFIGTWKRESPDDRELTFTLPNSYEYKESGNTSSGTFSPTNGKESYSMDFTQDTPTADSWTQRYALRGNIIEFAEHGDGHIAPYPFVRQP